MPPKYRWFSEKEAEGLSPDLMAMADMARAKAGIPFIITSGLRTAEENKKAGGADDSAHLTGEAFDLRCSDSVSRFKMVKALLESGFLRIGIYEKHIHADVSRTLPFGVFWVSSGN